MALVLGQVPILVSVGVCVFGSGEDFGPKGNEEEEVADVEGPSPVASGDEGVEGTAFCLGGLGKVR